MSKEVEQLKADLELVTKTAKVLATKLDKISQKVELLLGSIEGVKIPQEAFTKTDQFKQPSAQKEASMRTKVATPAPRPAMVTESKATRLLDSFLGQVQTMTSGKEIASALSRLRDQVMQAAEVGFHPAFHEMGRYADQIKKIKTISTSEKEELLEKIYDWKTRLSA